MGGGGARLKLKIDQSDASIIGPTPSLPRGVDYHSPLPLAPICVLRLSLSLGSHSLKYPFVWSFADI